MTTIWPISYPAYFRDIRPLESSGSPCFAPGSRGIRAAFFCPRSLRRGEMGKKWHHSTGSAPVRISKHDSWTVYLQAHLQTMSCDSWLNVINVQTWVLWTRPQSQRLTTEASSLQKPWKILDQFSASQARWKSGEMIYLSHEGVHLNNHNP